MDDESHSASSARGTDISRMDRDSQYQIVDSHRASRKAAVRRLYPRNRLWNSRDRARATSTGESSSKWILAGGWATAV